MEFEDLRSYTRQVYVDKGQAKHQAEQNLLNYQNEVA